VDQTGSLMDEPVVLVAGEVDGRELVMHQPINRIRIPARLDLASLLDTHDPTDPTMVVLNYDVVLDPLGYPSRDDQGRLRYQLTHE
jgi:hypothetical protein